MQAKVFSIEKTHQHILFCSEIQSFVSITDRNYKTLACPYNVSVLTIESVARNLFVFGFQSERNDYSQEYTFGLRPACDKLINFLDSQLNTRYSKLSSIEARGTVNLLLSGTVLIKIARIAGSMYNLYVVNFNLKILHFL